jgi:uncharacterized membrane protein (DUF373 family)
MELAEGMPGAPAMPAETAPSERWWPRLVKSFEHVVVYILMGLLMVVVSNATIELGWLLLRDMSSTRVLMLDAEEMLELFGFFLLVLIGVELLTTLKSFIRSGAIHGEVVLEVALIAVAQKIILLDTSKTTAGALLGIAGLVLALAAAFWSVRAGKKPAL